MLTEQEREWLERRKNRCNRCARRGYCHFGNEQGFNTETCRFWEVLNSKGEILVRNYFRESAEFEARVSEKLAERAFRLSDERDISEAVVNDKMKRGMGWHVLKKVRLAVEAEMDK